MARRQQLNETQVAGLFEPPTTQRELVRHYTLSNSDLVAIRRYRGDQNRLGYALMLCYLRFPGRALRTGERPPAPLLAFVSAQIDVLTGGIDEYLATDRSRQRHAILCQEQLGLRPFGRRTGAELTDVLLARAIENDSLAFLAELVMQTCRERAIVVPSAAALERLCADLRHGARRETYRRLTAGLSPEQRKRLDGLTEHREGSNLSWLAWLRQMPEAAKPMAMLGLIERLEHARAVGLEPGRGHLVHQARLAQLAREAGRTTVQHVAEYERQRRHATLVATTLDITASLTDQAIDLFDRLVGAMFRKAEGRHARAFQADARAINEKVRLYAHVGAALIAARQSKQDAYGAITTVIPWERFCATVAQAEELARPDEFDTLEKLGEHYAGFRRWSPAFLETFEFEASSDQGVDCRGSDFFAAGAVSAFDAPVSGLGGAVRLGMGVPTWNTGKFSESPMITRGSFWLGLSSSAMRVSGLSRRRRSGTAGRPRRLTRRGSLGRRRHCRPARHGHVDVKRRENALPEIVRKFNLVQSMLALAHCACSSGYVSRK